MGSGHMAMMQTNAIWTMVIFISISFFIAIIAIAKTRSEMLKKESEDHVKFVQQAHKEKMREVQSLAKQRENDFNYLRNKKLQNEKHLQQLEILRLQKELAEKSEVVNESKEKKLIN